MYAALRTYAHCPWGTYSQLFIDGTDFAPHAVEKPWVPHPDHPGGTPFLSCLPAGRYLCIRRPHFTRREAKYVIVSHGLHVFERKEELPPEGGRYADLFHAANEPTEVTGCVGLGTPQHWVHNRWAVGRSVVTMQEFNALMPDVFDLEIFR